MFKFNFIIFLICLIDFIEFYYIRKINLIISKLFIIWGLSMDDYDFKCYY